MKRKNDYAEMSFGNRIKLTPIGQDIIQSVEWDASSSYPSRKGLTSECHLTSKHILPHVSKYSKQIPHSIHKYQHVTSKKAKKAHFMWLKSQQSITLGIQKQVQRRQVENSKEYPWDKATSYYKENINTIIDKWNDCQKEEKKRVKERIKDIYHKKYNKSVWLYQATQKKAEILEKQNLNATRSQ